MFNRDPIGLWLLTSVVGGLAAHAAAAWLYRRSYARLRGAYTTAIAHVQRTGGAPDALVRAQALHRQFIRASAPSWLAGLGTHLRTAFVVCAIGGVALMVATGRFPPIVAGVALLFAIGLRRILLATALLLAVFAVTSLTSPSGRPDHSARVQTADGTTPPAPVRHR